MLKFTDKTGGLKLWVCSPFFGCPRPLPLRERWRSLSINFLSLDMAIGFGAPTLSSAGVSVSLAGLALRRALCLGRVLTCLMTSTSIWSSKCTLGAERSAPLRAFSSISIAMVVVMMGAQGSGQRCVALARARSTVLRVARLRDSHWQLGSTPKALFARVPWCIYDYQLAAARTECVCVLLLALFLALCVGSPPLWTNLRLQHNFCSWQCNLRWWWYFSSWSFAVAQLWTVL